GISSQENTSRAWPLAESGEPRFGARRGQAVSTSVHLFSTCSGAEARAGRFRPTWAGDPAPVPLRVDRRGVSGKAQGRRPRAEHGPAADQRRRRDDHGRLVSAPATVSFADVAP